MALCAGVCRWQESDAQHVKVNEVTRHDDDCPALTNDAAKDAIAADVIRDQKGTVSIGDGKCKEPCECKRNDPPPWPPNWTSIPFEWEYETEITLGTPPRTRKKKCKYTVKGTVDIKLRIIEGVCWPKLVKGKTKK